ncbi:DCST2 protein, partial [Nothoprocta ornata]|nr:DCST2 protein [Nothoprocta ornata]
RSALGFALGMALGSAYGALVLLAQSHNIWYCLVTTVSLGTALALGMAFSVKVRVTVLLTLPHIFTSKRPPSSSSSSPSSASARLPWRPVPAEEGKMLLLLLALGMATAGPCANVLHNVSRAAEAMACGAELALNQTAERLQRARQPLLNVLAKIKDIARKAKAVGDRVRRFFRSIMDSVTHVARALRNVWHWLARLGQLCNQQLGTPRRRCLRLFSEAQDKCERAVPFLYFLCYIIAAFKPLCGLANGARRSAAARALGPRAGTDAASSRCSRAALLHHPPAARYVRPRGPWFSRQERQRYGLELAAVLRHVLLGLGLILADYSVFWLLDLLRHELRGETVARAPSVLGISVNGSGYTSEIFRDLVGAFEALQQGNVSVLSQRCRLRPVEPDYGTYMAMGILYGVCLSIALVGSYVGRLRRAICAAYYPEREQ